MPRVDADERVATSMAGQPTASGITQVFVSYPRKSKHAQLLAQVVLPRFLPPSIKVWVDVHELDGDRWWASARAAIDQCAAQVIIVDETVRIPPPGAVADPADAIPCEIIYGRNNGLRPIYLAADETDRKDFLTAGRDRSQANAEFVAPDENVIVVMSSHVDWEAKLVETIGKVATFRIPAAPSWGLREHRGSVTAFRGDHGGSVGVPSVNTDSGIALSSSGGHAVAGTYDGAIRVLQPNGTGKPRVITVLDTIGQPLALEQIGRMTMRCIVRRVDGVFVFDFELGSTAVSNLHALVDEVRDAALVSGEPAYITAEYHLAGAAELLAGCAGPESRWFSIDACVVGHRTHVVGIEQTGATREAHAAAPGGEPTHLTAGDWESVRIVRSATSRAVVVAGNVGGELDLREVCGDV